MTISTAYYFFINSNRLLRETIEKATKANVVFIKTKKHQKAEKPRHSYQSMKKVKIVVFKQRTRARLNEITNTTEVVEEQGTAQEDEVQEDQTQNIKNFTMITRDISIIAAHRGYVVAITV